MNIYTKIDYRVIIQTLVAERKRLDPRVNFQQIALATRIPKSYLSRVTHGRADLNPDQLYLVCLHLELGEAESAYLQLLLDYARAAVKARKDALLAEIRAVQAKHLDAREHLAAASAAAPERDLAAYYLDPLIQLTHVCLALPRYQRDAPRLARDLGVNPRRLNAAIAKLEAMALVERRDDRVTPVVKKLHLPRDAPLCRAWRNQLKLAASARLAALPEEQGHSFAVLFSADEDTRKEIYGRFLAFLREAEELVGRAATKGVYQMSFELFPWV
jgi:uncharacterized protein (TIGR02147 family)